MPVDAKGSKRKAQRASGSGESYLTFTDETDPAGRLKTRKWSVWSAKHNDIYLGEVRWMPGWRKYVFIPGEDTAFDAKCLTQLAEYCERQTANHQKGWKANV